VLVALAARFPEERFLYLGDTARVPYGTKSARTVAAYTLRAADFLLQRDVKGIVIACNTASALGMGALQAHAEVPVLGVIEPGAEQALAHSRGGRIAVLATRSTVVSGAYPGAIHESDPARAVQSLPCPLFVPLVEEGWLDHPVTATVAQTYLAELQADVDTVILGCTHYPLLKGMLEGLRPDLAWIDSAQAVAQRIALWFEHGVVARGARPADKPPIECVVTDDPVQFGRVALPFMGSIPLGSVEMVDL